MILTTLSIILAHTLLVNNIKEKCPGIVDPAGCYHMDSQQIYLDFNLNSWKRRMAFYHEGGHYLMRDLTIEQYKDIFGEGDLLSLQERAARHFNLWMIYRKVPVREAVYFSTIINKRPKL